MLFTLLASVGTIASQPISIITFEPKPADRMEVVKGTCGTQALSIARALNEAKTIVNLQVGDARVVGQSLARLEDDLSDVRSIYRIVILCDRDHSFEIDVARAQPINDEKWLFSKARFHIVGHSLVEYDSFAEAAPGRLLLQVGLFICGSRGDLKQIRGERRSFPS